MNKKSSQRLVGFIQFFTGYYGFIGTNTAYIEENSPITYKGIYVNDSQVDNSIHHKDGDWVTFELKGSHNRLSAINLKSAYTDEGICTALLNYWKHPQIEGWIPKHTKHYDEHAIAGPIKNFLNYSEENKYKLIKILC